MPPKLFYAVHIGRKTGVFRSWAECEEQVLRHSGSSFKSFSNLKDAEAFVKDGQASLKRKAEEENQEVKEDEPEKEEVVKAEIKKPKEEEKKESTKNPLELDVYCDGSATHNGGPNCRAGYGVFFGHGDKRNTSKEIFDDPSNNRAELHAIKRTLEILQETDDISKYKVVTIHSDSEYSIKSLKVWMPNWKRNGWKTANKQPVKNVDLLKSIDAHLQRHSHVFFHHVRAHTNNTDPHSLGNDQADLLAKSTIGAK
jgi:ribonuclease HI